MRLKSLVASVVLLASAGAAHAIPVQVNFTSNFSSGPISNLSGSFVYEAATPTSAVQSLTSVDLNINGHAYALGELGFLDSGSNVLIGGLVNTIGTIMGVSFDDFFFSFNRLSSTFNHFAYSSPGVSFHPLTLSGTVSIGPPAVTAVPEPATLGLMSLGLMGLLAARRRKSAI